MSLKYSFEDEWLGDYAETNGLSMDKHPLYLALKGEVSPLKEWFEFRELNLQDRLKRLLEIYQSLVLDGQLEPIVITRDNVIVTGHKRCVCFLAMGKDKIKATYE